MIDKKILILIAVVGIVAVGVVGATIINNDSSMKQEEFDGIKMSVPQDAEIIKTVNGYQDNKYGLDIKTFQDNESVVGYLSNVSDGRMVPLTNQPPQSVAFEENGSTYILITNGKEAICVGAVDSNLATEMANTVVFNDGKIAEKDHGFFGIGAKTLNKDTDFNLIILLLMQVNTDIFSLELFEGVLVEVIELDGGDAGDVVPEDTDNLTNNTTDVLSEDDCRAIAMDYVPENCTISTVEQLNDTYTFYVVDETGLDMGSITVNATTGEVFNNTQEVVVEENNDFEDNYYDDSYYDDSYYEDDYYYDEEY